MICAIETWFLFIAFLVLFILELRFERKTVSSETYLPVGKQGRSDDNVFSGVGPNDS